MKKVFLTVLVIAVLIAGVLLIGGNVVLREQLTAANRVIAAQNALANGEPLEAMNLIYDIPPEMLTEEGRRATRTVKQEVVRVGVNLAASRLREDPLEAEKLLLLTQRFATVTDVEFPARGKVLLEVLAPITTEIKKRQSYHVVLPSDRLD